MRQTYVIHGLALACALSPQLLFWKRGKNDGQRDEFFGALYDVVAGVYETSANLKPEWSENWDARHQHHLPPKFEFDQMLPARTILAAREMRFARALLQRHRWRSVRQPLFQDVDPIAWAALQRRLHSVTADLLEVQETHVENIRQDEIDWISRAIEGYDQARLFLRNAERNEEPLERQISSSAYLAIHLGVQLSDRLIERQRFELSKDE